MTGLTLSDKTFSYAEGAVSALFAAQAAPIKYGMQAQGLRLQAQGLRIKAAGDIAEGKEYTLASTLARQNEQYVVESTAIQQKQLDRQITQTIGGKFKFRKGSSRKARASEL